MEDIMNTVDFNTLCKDFAARKPKGVPIDTVPFASILWDDGDASSNDLLRRYLVDSGIDFINDFNGTVWFLYDGNWTRCKVHYDRRANIAHFSRCIFA